jgi:MYXO-CTERM domain-containing protein
VAAWHHPPYTKGEHDSDAEYAHILMRQNAVPILEDHGVDLVLGGHSHSYERSFLLDGHYGPSTTLTAAMKKDPGSGRPEDGAGYVKAPGPHQGAVYVVLGNAGQVSEGPLNHPVMVVSALALGSLVVDVDGRTLQGTFLRETGAVGDHFVIRKTEPAPAPGCDGPCPEDGGLPGPDAGSDVAGADVGGGVASSDGGCGCALGATPARSWAWVLVMLAVLVLRRRR